MAASLRNLSNYDTTLIPDGSEFTIAIVVSEYHNDITFELRNACYGTLIEHGVSADNIEIDYAPGAYELPLAAQTVFMGTSPDAVIVLGCVIKGDTDHDQYINEAVARAIMTLGIDYDTPFIFGLLTTNNLEQAQDRAGGKHGNKGTECAIAALKMLSLKQRHDITDEELDELFEDEDEDED